MKCRQSCMQHYAVLVLVQRLNSNHKNNVKLQAVLPGCKSATARPAFGRPRVPSRAAPPRHGNRAADKKRTDKHTHTHTHTHIHYSFIDIDCSGFQKLVPLCHSSYRWKSHSARLSGTVFGRIHVLRHCSRIEQNGAGLEQNGAEFEQNRAKLEHN